jgi:hypothetical protein
LLVQPQRASPFGFLLRAFHLGLKLLHLAALGLR